LVLQESHDSVRRSELHLQNDFCLFITFFEHFFHDENLEIVYKHLFCGECSLYKDTESLAIAGYFHVFFCFVVTLGVAADEGTTE